MLIVPLIVGVLLGATSVIGNPLVDQTPAGSLSGLNLAQLAALSGNYSFLSNSSVYSLYEAAQNVMNASGADAVLFNMLPYGDTPVVNETATPFQLLVESRNGSFEQDLKERFRTYFVGNVTTDGSTTPGSGWVVDHFDAGARPYSAQQAQHSSMWDITKNFFKNQANAFIGAVMTPFRVGSRVMVSSSLQHAQMVAENGATTAPAFTNSILLRTVALPQNAANYAVDLTTNYQARVDAYEHRLKDSSNVAIEQTIDTVKYGYENANLLAVRYIAKPVAAFVGTQMTVAGMAVSSVGSQITSTANKIATIGNNLTNAGNTAVGNGNHAMVWALQN